MNIEKHPIEIIIHKFGEMIYYSQLDLIHILERALRRTNLPLYFTQGYNPHVKISFANGLKLGEEGKIKTTLYFTKPISKIELEEKLYSQLPHGLSVAICT